jgi:hypothetical protein
MSRPASVFELPDDFLLPPVDELIDDPQRGGWGCRCNGHAPPDRYRSSCESSILQPSLRPGRSLFGARHPISDALVGGESFGDEGFFIEYFAIDRNPAGGWNVHRLLQRGHSVVYSDGEEETEDCVPAAEIDDPVGLSIHEPPAWKLWVANWPTCDEKPMRFVGQVKPPENDVTRELLNWLCTIYLFCSTSDAGTRYKIVDQDRGAQTAEEHYELEEQLSRDH